MYFYLTLKHNRYKNYMIIFRSLIQFDIIFCTLFLENKIFLLYFTILWYWNQSALLKKILLLGLYHFPFTTSSSCIINLNLKKFEYSNRFLGFTIFTLVPSSRLYYDGIITVGKIKFYIYFEIPCLRYWNSDSLLFKKNRFNFF